MEVMKGFWFGEALGCGGGRERESGGDVLKAVGNVENEVDEEAVAWCLNLVGGEEYEGFEKG